MFMYINIIMKKITSNNIPYLWHITTRILSRNYFFVIFVDVSVPVHIKTNIITCKVDMEKVAGINNEKNYMATGTEYYDINSAMYADYSVCYSLTLNVHVSVLRHLVYMYSFSGKQAENRVLFVLILQTGPQKWAGISIVFMPGTRF